MILKDETIVETGALIAAALPGLLGESVSLINVHINPGAGNEGVLMLQFPERRDLRTDGDGARIDHATFFWQTDWEGDTRRVKLSWGHYDLNRDAAFKDFRHRVQRGY